MPLFNDIYLNRKIFLTGHTGFKGSWLTLWLEQLGAKICGFSRETAVSEPNHFSLLKMKTLEDCRGDVRDETSLQDAMQRFQPEIVFHLAAQPLVRLSYQEPLETFATNVLGTANLLQACQNCDSVRAVVVITTDKVYQNREWNWGYREIDTLGGHDPYAASKACSELVVDCFRKSFFEKEKHENGQTRILAASIRAGNVIGGGDWASDRIVPDLVRAATKGETTIIRMPHAVRPWEHVLEPLAAYLLIGQRLLEGRADIAQAWNIGPDENGIVTVGQLAELAQTYWDKLKIDFRPSQTLPHETRYLSLDCSKAKHQLGWQPVWSFDETVKHTIDWYRTHCESNEILSLSQLSQFIADAKDRQAVWTA